MYALREALRELKQEGLKNRYARYQAMWALITNCLINHGFDYIIDDKVHGKLITSFIIPENSSFSFDDFHSFLYRHHITIYPGKIAEHNTFRIATIGDLNTEDIDHICKIIDNYFSKK